MSSTRTWVVLLAAALLTSCAHARTAQDTALGATEFYSGRVLAVGLAAGTDAAGEPQKLWLADEKAVRELRSDGDVEVWKPPRFTRILRLEVADLDGDGADEWVVLIDQGRMRSLLVRVGEDGRETVGRPWNGWLRPVRDADGAWGLLGQRSGGEQPFRGHIKRVTLEGDSLVEGERLDLPPGTPLYDWFNVWVPPAEGEEAPTQRLFQVEDSGKLVERDPRSPRAITWRGGERVAGRIVEATRLSQSMLGDEEELVVRLLPPIVDTSDADGAPAVLMVGGTQTPVAVLRDLRVFQGGDVRLLVPDDRGLREVRRTPLVGRAVVAATVWEIEPGRTVWAAAVWMKVSGGFARPESRVFLFDPATGDLVSHP